MNIKPVITHKYINGWTYLSYAPTCDYNIKAQKKINL